MRARAGWWTNLRDEFEGDAAAGVALVAAEHPPEGALADEVEHLVAVHGGATLLD